MYITGGNHLLHKAQRNWQNKGSCDKQVHLKFYYLRLFELLVIICFQFNKWTKDILILVSILVPEQTSTLEDRVHVNNTMQVVWVDTRTEFY